MNLAEIKARDKDLSEAITLYTKAQNLAPDRGLIYLRLGQLYILKDNDMKNAKSIWSMGLENTVDEELKNRIKELLMKY
jgi:predicted Zn-dependent protease